MGLPSFKFLGDILNLNEKEEITLIEGHVLRRANLQEVGFIRNYLIQHQALWTPGINWYEYEAIPGKNNSVSFKPIEGKPFNYFVIEFKGMNSDLDLTLSLLLSNSRLRSIFTGIFLPVDQGVELNLSDNPLSTVNFLSDHDDNKLRIKSITQEELLDIKNMHSIISGFDFVNRDFEFITRALKEFRRLGDVPKDSTLNILAHISILEILVTSNAFGESIENSIRNQLHSKLSELNPLFDRPVDIHDYFKGPYTNTISTYINKIYLYRNDIAHGNQSDFDGKLHTLKSGRTKIPDFLNELVTQALRYALNHPNETKKIKEKLLPSKAKKTCSSGHIS